MAQFAEGTYATEGPTHTTNYLLLLSFRVSARTQVLPFVFSLPPSPFCIGFNFIIVARSFSAVRASYASGILLKQSAFQTGCRTGIRNIAAGLWCWLLCHIASGL